MSPAAPAAKHDPDFENLLEFLRTTRGFDFTGYKRGSLMRRIEHRMAIAGVTGFAEYHDYLEVHPEEYPELFNTILINVTSFFRDADAWEALAHDVLPGLLAARSADAPVRVWCAGCSSGEEAYTLAIVLAEALGDEAFRRRVKIYATDVDEEALSQARHAAYPAKALEAVPEALRSKYFEASNGRNAFRLDLRRSVIFGRHDLVQDAPISRIDLLVCRNVLMYFNAEAQERILSRLHFALAPAGVIFLGKAEMLLAHAALFTPVDLKHRLFARAVGSASLEPRGRTPRPDEGPDAERQRALGRLRQSVFEADRTAQIVVDVRGNLALANRQAQNLFALNERDLRRPFHDLEMSYRPMELRSVIDQVMTERRPATHREVEWAQSSGDLRRVDIHVVPLTDEAGQLLGVGIGFTDVSRVWQVQRELQRATQERETASEELQSTVEELETTNEELQSTVEELETTNEELQSTNEEMETMNEELQSTNAELQTVNDELHQRTEALNDTGAFTQSILAGVRDGVAVVDADLQVEAWNPQAQDLWGLQAAEVVGKNLMALDVGLPVEKLRGVIRAILAGEAVLQEAMLDAVSRRGKPLRCRVTLTPRLGAGGQVRGVILVMEQWEHEG